MKYPEIYEWSDVEKWQETYLRKELRSGEWDLMLNEPCPDVLEIPFFTEEFCDKLVDNLSGISWKQIPRWGTPVDVAHLKDLNMDEMMNDVLRKYAMSISYHRWRTEGSRFKEVKGDNMIQKMREGQDIRLHHDYVDITCYIKLDSTSEGGELIFPKYDTVIEPKQGHLYMFPGQITHRYGIRLISKGERYNLFSYLIP
jgi:hypothetical protein